MYDMSQEDQRCEEIWFLPDDEHAVTGGYGKS